jgi:hypothetical protein
MRLSRQKAKRQRKFAEWQSGQLRKAEGEAKELADAARRLLLASGPAASMRALDGLMQTVATYDLANRNPNEFCLE